MKPGEHPGGNEDQGRQRRHRIRQPGLGGMPPFLHFRLFIHHRPLSRPRTQFTHHEPPLHIRLPLSGKAEDFGGPVGKLIEMYRFGWKRRIFRIFRCEILLAVTFATQPFMN